ncbi:MAG: ABC transporter permease [Candidatus Dojkabacteria bacterium]
MKTVILGRRVLNQLIRDRWFLAFSFIAPILVIVVLNIFFNTFPDQFPVENYIVGIAATVVFVITFVLSMISIVEERVNGTLQRMFVNGVSRITIIGGYLLGYLVIATIQAIIVIFLTLNLFELDMTGDTIATLILAILLLAIASVALGLLISSFVRRQVQIIPFIPMVMLPTIFLSGIIVEVNKLPVPAQVIGQITPLYYTNSIIDLISTSAWELSEVIPDIISLIGIILFVMFLSSLTLKPAE